MFPSTQYDEEALRSKIFLPRFTYFSTSPVGPPSSFAAASKLTALSHCHTAAGWCSVAPFLGDSSRVEFVTSLRGQTQQPEGVEAEGAGRLRLSAAQQQQQQQRTEREGDSTPLSRQQPCGLTAAAGGP